MAAFSIRLNLLGDEVHTLDLPIESQWLVQTLEGTDVRVAPDEGPGRLSLRLYRSGSDIIVSGAARATLVVACSRCLEDVPLDIETELSLVMSEAPDERSGGGEVELTDDDLGREYYAGDVLVFDDIVRDHLLLELPMQPVCVDPPCPEWVKSYLTTAEEAEAQAAEKPLDPRLAPLQSLSGKLGPKN